MKLPLLSNQKLRVYFLVALMLAGFYPVQLFSNPVLAAPLTTISDQMSRLNESTASSHTFHFVTPSGVAAGQTIVITFPSGIFAFGGSYNFNDMTLAEGNSNNCDTASFSNKTLAGSPSGTTWGATYSADVVTFTSGTGTITADRCVRVILATNGAGHTLTNPSVASNTSYSISISVGSGADTGSLAVIVLNDGGTPDGDQVLVQAQVETALNFDIDVATTNCNNSTETATNTVNLGTLALGTPSSSGASINFICLDVGSNANGGVEVFVQSSRANASGGLVHSSNLDTIVSQTQDLNSGGVDEGYGLRISSVGTPSIGSLTATSPYNSATPADVGAIPGTSAAAASLVGSTAPVQTGNTSRIAVEVSAKAGAGTAAGSYTDTLTFTATATY